MLGRREHRERDSRIDQPEATSFGVDDRPEVVSSDGGKQGALFADTTDDQRTLTGERAASQCLFESDDTDEPTNDEVAETKIDGTTTTQAVATDGGYVEEPDDSEDDTESENMRVAIPRKELAAVADYVEYERNTVERHAGDGPKTEELTEYVEECRSALSVLDDTDENGRIPRVVAVGAADELHGAAKKRTGEVGQKLQRLVDVLRQALDEQPRSDEDERTDTEIENADAASDREPMTDGGRDGTFDPDEETVTEAWEGAFIHTSWGYDQTNVELARIIEVSGSDKTVLARRVGAERVGHGRTSKQLRPSAKQFGDDSAFTFAPSATTPPSVGATHSAVTPIWTVRLVGDRSTRSTTEKATRYERRERTSATKAAVPSIVAIFIHFGRCAFDCPRELATLLVTSENQPFEPRRSRINADESRTPDATPTPNRRRFRPRDGRRSHRRCGCRP